MALAWGCQAFSIRLMAWWKQTIPVTLLTFSLRGVQTIRIKLITLAQGSAKCRLLDYMKLYLIRLVTSKKLELYVFVKCKIVFIYFPYYLRLFP